MDIDQQAKITAVETANVGSPTRTDSTQETSGASRFAGVLGVLGQNGFYTQDFLLNTWPELAGWRGLYSTAAANVLNHTLLAFVEGWGPISQMVEAMNERLGVKYTVKYLGAEDVTKPLLRANLREGVAMLFYLWSPHPLLAKYALNRIQLPSFTSADAFEAGQSDFPNDVLEKVYSKHLAKLAPLVVRMYSRFTLTNFDQSAMMSAIDNDGLSLFQGVCTWMQQSKDRWSTWLPAEEIECKPGQYLVPPDGLRCANCTAGFYSPGGATDICTACEPGFFSPMNASSMCISCDGIGNSFQEGRAATTCVDCPQNTQRYIGILSGNTREACQCKEGYWRHDGPGKPCAPCPIGASCAGRASDEHGFPSLPTPISDYWMPLGVHGELLLPAELPDTVTQFKSSELVFKCESHRCHRECDYHCADHEDHDLVSAHAENDHSPAANLSAAEVGVGHAGSHAAATPTGIGVGHRRRKCTRHCHSCYEGFVGNMCSLCDDGYFRAVETCFRCPSPEGVTAIDWIMTIGLISVVVIVWLVMNKMAAGNYDALELTLLYLQSVALAQNYSIDWPEPIKTFKHYLTIVNFEMVRVAFSHRCAQLRHDSSAAVRW